MKKRTFLLLETLIAFFLATLCTIPLVTQPLKAYKKQIESLLILEKERLADWTFSEVQETLLKNAIPWKKIPSKGELSEVFALPKAEISIPGTSSRTINRSFYFKCTGEKVTAQGQITRQVNIYIKLDASEYQYRLPIVHLPE